MRLAAKYGDRPIDEWPMLFQRILQNAIRDSFRRAKVRALWTTLFSSLSPNDADDSDPLETITAEHEIDGLALPHRQLEQKQTLAIIEKEIEKLPPRQREAFLLRYWEEMDIAETAAVMGCSEGSVKTHCSRATHTLAEALGKKGVQL